MRFLTSLCLSTVLIFAGAGHTVQAATITNGGPGGFELLGGGGSALRLWFAGENIDGEPPITDLFAMSQGDFDRTIATYQEGFTWLRDPRFISIAAVQQSRNEAVEDAGRATLISRIEQERSALEDRQAELADVTRENRQLADGLTELATTRSRAEAAVARLGAVTGYTRVTGEGVRIVVDDNPTGDEVHRERKVHTVLTPDPPLTTGFLGKGGRLIERHAHELLRSERLTRRQGSFGLSRAQRLCRRRRAWLGGRLAITTAGECNRALAGCAGRRRPSRSSSGSGCS